MSLVSLAASAADGLKQYRFHSEFQSFSQNYVGFSAMISGAWEADAGVTSEAGAVGVVSVGSGVVSGASLINKPNHVDAPAEQEKLPENQLRVEAYWTDGPGDGGRKAQRLANALVRPRTSLVVHAHTHTHLFYARRLVGHRQCRGGVEGEVTPTAEIVRKNISLQ